MESNVDSAKPKQDMDPAARYKRALDYLSKPESSYTLLYEPHLIKIPNENKKNTKFPKPRKATPKKISAKLLPNVRTLTATGMLNGVSVRYVSKTKKIELLGKIQGACYLCGCESCNYSKTITAEVFENHAGCKTSHPNNHIHFENGNSMHMVVMELNRTPESALFDALHTLTATVINHNAFSSWKDSLKAAPSRTS